MSNRRRPPQALILFAVLLGVAAVVRAWFEGHAIHAGLWGIEDCTHGCRGVRWDDVPNSDLDFLIAGYGGTVSSLLAAVLGVLIGVAGVQGKPSPVPLRAARLASTAAIITIAWFLIRMFTDSHLDVSWGLVVGVAGAVGVAATLPHASATNSK